jgi:hypothetical protein
LRKRWSTARRPAASRELQQALAHVVSQRKDLREAESHPARVVVVEGRREARRAPTVSITLRANPAQASSSGGRAGDSASKRSISPTTRPAGVVRVAPSRKRSPPLGPNGEDAELLHVPVGDAREATDGLGHGRTAHFLAFADEAYAEGPVVLEAGLRHVHVAGLEDAQGAGACPGRAPSAGGRSAPRRAPPRPRPAGS